MKEVEYISLKDIRIFLNKIVVFAFKKWKILLFFGFTGGVLGFVYATFQKPVYHAKLSFLLNENDQGSTLNISSLAGLSGLAGITGGGNVNEEKLLFIANSRYLIGTSLLEEAEINGVKKMMVNHYIELFQLSGSFKSDTLLKDFTEFKHKKLEDLNFAENKIMDRIISQIIDGKKFLIEARKKSGIIAQGSGIIVLECKYSNEEFAKVFIEILYNELSSYYTNKTIQRQLKNYHLIKNRADSLKEALYDKENFGAELSDDNIGVIKMKGRVEMNRAKRDIEILSLMYGEVMKNLEVAKFALDNQTPVFQTIDYPTYPLEKKKMSRLNTAIFCSVFIVFFAFIILLIRDFKKILGVSKQEFT